MSFQAFNFDPRIAAGVTAAGYTVPTPIQAQAIPAVLQGRDVIGLAQTGTGKTAAFGCPSCSACCSGPRGQVRALILAPTRELAEQIHVAISELGRRPACAASPSTAAWACPAQMQKLRDGVEIVVACPGRLLDHLRQGRPRPVKHLEVLVLDEADRMFDMGFLPDIRRILRTLPAERQTLLFSATMPDDIGQLAREMLRNPADGAGRPAAPVATVSHALYPVPSHLKTPLLLALLDEHRHQVGAGLHPHQAPRQAGGRAAAARPATAPPRCRATCRRTAGRRRSTASATARIQILVATDIAARGIDVDAHLARHQL